MSSFELPGGTLPGGSLPGGGGLGGGGSSIGTSRYRPRLTAPRRPLHQLTFDDLPKYSDVDLGKVDKNRLTDRRYQNAIKMRYAQLLRKRFNLNYAASMAASEIMWQRESQHVSRGTTALGAIGKVLSAPGEFTAGFVAGGMGAKHHPGDNVWDRIAHNFAQAAKEGVHNVSTTHKQAGDYLMDAGVIGNKYAGFAASTLFDPTMYVTFGATAPAKFAARDLLALTYKDAQSRAISKLAEGKGVATFFGKRYTDVGELTHAIRTQDVFRPAIYENGKLVKSATKYPMDMPQALDQVREVQLGIKADIRAGRPIERKNILTGEVKMRRAGPIKTAAAFVLPTNVQGGRGIRFAGMQIPGTGRATSALASKLRGDLTTAVAKGNPVAEGIVHGFMTNPELRLANDDTIRALALTEVRDMQRELQGAKVGAEEASRTAARGGGKKFIAPSERKGAMRLEAPLLPLSRGLHRAFTASDADSASYTIAKPKTIGTAKAHGVPDALALQLEHETAGWSETSKRV